MSSTEYTQQEITELLEGWSDGEPEGLDKLVRRVLDEVRYLAHRALAREPDRHAWQTTELVNEVYLRLVGKRSVSWRNREQFFGFLADLMRRILVDRARRQLAAKRGSRAPSLSLDTLPYLTEVPDHDMVAVNDALDSLAAVDSRQHQIVKLRFFMGLTHQEISEVLGLGTRTVARDWRHAKAFLRHQLSSL